MRRPRSKFRSRRLYAAIRNKQAKMPSTWRASRRLPSFPGACGGGLLCGALAAPRQSGAGHDGLAWLSVPLGALLGIAPMAWLFPQLTRTLNEVSAGFINLAEGRLNIPVRQSWHCALGDVQVRLESMRICTKSRGGRS